MSSWRIERRGFARWLVSRGVEPGHPVATILPNSTEAVVAYFGILRAGAIVVPLNPLLAPPEIATRVDGVRARVVVTPDSFPELDAEPLVAPVERAGGVSAVILYTSGTTGGPKGAMLTHAGLRANAQACVEAFELTADDVLLASAPFSHVFGMSFLQNAALLAGAKVVLLGRFEPVAALALMTEHGVSVFGGVPTMFTRSPRLPRPGLPPLRLAHSGGAPLPVETLRAFEARLDCPVLEGYGLTELSGVATTHRDGAPQKPGSAGVPVPGTELRIVSLDGEPLPPGEPGEVQLRGPSVITEYRIGDDVVRATDAEAGSQPATSAMLQRGRLPLPRRPQEGSDHSRRLAIYPREVEEVLYEHPDVFEAAVIGIPHPTHGEEVVAVVVLRPGVEPDPDGVKEFVRERVAAYKYPRHVIVVDELPKGPSGKILKRELDRDAIARTLAG